MQVKFAQALPLAKKWGLSIFEKTSAEPAIHDRISAPTLGIFPENLLVHTSGESVLTKNPTNVFYVDDDADDQMLFSEAFREIQDISSTNLNLFRADNCQEFFDLIKKSSVTPDITFLDINMPVKNGFECLTEIRTTKSLKDQTVVMLSTSESEELIRKSYDLGANKYIVKPPDFIELKNAIAKCLEEFKFSR